MGFQRFMNFDEMVIDNFAGGGGASTGIEAAIGRPVDVAINHDPQALEMHAANHPNTIHLCESIWDVNPLDVTGGRPVGLVHLSPDCKHHSRAKGGKPVEKHIRGLAWVGIRWAALTKPRLLTLENVGEFEDWGPLIVDENGNHRPCPKRKGKTFKSFCNELRKLGYEVQYWKLRACDYGAPTIRTRLFLVARNDGQPIVKPIPTHGDPKSEEVKRGDLLPWKTSAGCIDWSIPCPSIFERKKPLVDATCRRIAKGIMRYVVNSDDPFIVRIGHTNANGAYSKEIHAPLSTIVSKNEHLVQPFISRQFGQGIGTPLNAPIGTVIAGGMGKSALCTAFLAKHYTGVVGAPVDGPVHTITAQDHHSLVTTNLIHMGHGEQCKNGKPRWSHGIRDIEMPLNTVTSSGSPGAVVQTCLQKYGGCTHHAEVRSFLVKYYGNEKEGCNLADPIHTVRARDRLGLVTIAGEEYQIIDIGMRMLQPRELFRAQGFPDSYIIGDDPGQGLKLTKSAQVRMCGNSVCPDVMESLIRANYSEDIGLQKAA